MDKIDRLLEEAMPVLYRSQDILPLKYGILDTNVNSFFKSNTISFAFEHIKDDIVATSYTNIDKDTTQADFMVDVVVMKGDDFRALKKLIDNHE